MGFFLSIENDISLNYHGVTATADGSQAQMSGSHSLLDGTRSHVNSFALSLETPTGLSADTTSTPFLCNVSWGSLH